MRSDSRLSRMLHVMLHMARHEGPMTSDDIARMLGTNPVVIRRTMAGLRDAGYVQSEKGHGGGWTIARDLASISLLDVYRAVGSERLFTIGIEHDSPECAVEQVVNDALGDALGEAEKILRDRLRTISLEELAQDFDARCASHPRSVASQALHRAIAEPDEPA